MKRKYFISDDLADLELVERDLENAGLSTPQIHVLSEDDAGLQNHHLHEVEAVLKKDVVHGTELGAIVGVIAAFLIIGSAWITGFSETYTWVPAIFLAVIALGFCTWEGGFIGIHKPHADFERFQGALHAGKHVLFVDITPEQDAILQRVSQAHPKLEAVGEGSATPGWVVGAQKQWDKFIETAP